MKIYSDTLTIEDLHRACDAIPAVYLSDRGYGMATGTYNGASYGSPIVLVEGRKRRFERVTLRAESSERPKNWRELDDSVVPPHDVMGATMGGRRSMPQHATYDEHGRWMARLFDIDPHARIKSAVNDFNGRDDFHAQTGGKYRASVTA